MECLVLPDTVHDCSISAELGHLACLRSTYEAGQMWDEVTCSDAAGHENIDCLQFAHEHGCPWDEQTCSSAATYGCLECLKYAHEQGCPWDEDTCSSAAEFGQLTCLTYAHGEGCPWNEETCFRAAQSGNLKCLIYAHTRGCPWSCKTTDEAARNGHENCLRYAINEGCPISIFTFRLAELKEHVSCMRCLLELIEHICLFAPVLSSQSTIYESFEKCDMLQNFDNMQWVVQFADARGEKCTKLRALVSEARNARENAARYIQNVWRQRWYDPDTGLGRRHMQLRSSNWHEQLLKKSLWLAFSWHFI